MAGSVLLVPDCGPGVGLGHLERMLALAEAIGGSEVTIAVPADDEGVMTRVTSRGVPAIGVPGGVNERAYQAADSLRPVLTILDGYTFAPAVQRLLRSQCRLVIVDDLGAPCDADLAVNPAPGGEANAVPGADRVLGGAEYALLARAYRAARQRRLDREPAGRTVLVATGGTDTGGLGVRLASALIDGDGDVTVTLVAGPEMNVAAASSDRLTVLDQPNGLAVPLAGALVYTGAAGTTAIQAACVGVPSVITAAAENQRSQSETLAATGCAVLSDTDTMVTETLRLLDDAERRREMAERGRALVDGLGAERVAAALRELTPALVRG